MKKHYLSGIGAAVVGAALLVACGDDDSPAAASTTAATVGSGGSGTGGSGTGGSNTGGSNTGGSGAPSCADYCAENIAACTGSNVQYLDPGQCEAFCGLFDAGTPGEMSGDTLACRLYHTGAAAGDPAVHCHHSGPYGGGVCDDSGDVCDAFCKRAMEICTGPYEAFSSMTECATACAGLSDAGDPFFASTSGDSLSCRGYHLQAAVDDPETHCGHVGGDAPCAP